MQRDDIDWKELRGAIAVLLFCVTAAAVMLYGSSYFERQMRQEFNRNDAQFRTISSRYLAVDEEEKLINEYYPEFLRLYNNGVIGGEQRLNWVEVLRETGNELGLGSLSYQVESQAPYTPEYPVNQGKFMIYSSNMELNTNLLHEGMLFDIFDALDNRARGIYSPISCVMQRSSSIRMAPDAANVTAQCELKWYTIRLADGTEIDI